MLTRELLVIGAGGHALSVLASLLRAGARIIGLVDANPGLAGTSMLGIPVLGGDDMVLGHDPARVRLVNGIGSVGRTSHRRTVHDGFIAKGYLFASVVDPTAIIGPGIDIEAGAQVLAGAVVQPGTRLGRNVIVNTRAVVDHNCLVGDHAHIATGAVLAGGVTVGAEALVGAGATIRQGIRIGYSAVVGAGAVAVADVPAASIVVGVPARIKERTRGLQFGEN